MAELDVDNILHVNPEQQEADLNLSVEKVTIHVVRHAGKEWRFDTTKEVDAFVQGYTHALALSEQRLATTPRDYMSDSQMAEIDAVAERLDG